VKFEKVKQILNEKVKDKYSDEQIKAIYASIKLLVQIDLKKIKE
jgi:hypothetical protein